MVDALNETRRVVKPQGTLVNLVPVIAPLRLEVIADHDTAWTKQVAALSVPEDVAAADAAMRHAVRRGWFKPDASSSFDLEVNCDSAADLRAYVDSRKIVGDEIPYEELEQQRHALAAAGTFARIRCRRPWMLTRYSAIGDY
jgi:hypothetical protein